MRLVRFLVDVAEVFVPRGTAEPRLPKVQPPCEEEAAGPGFHPTPQEGTDAAHRFPVFAHRLEQGKFLAVDPSGRHADDGLLQLQVAGDGSDVATDDWRGGREEAGEEKTEKNAESQELGNHL